MCAKAKQRAKEEEVLYILTGNYGTARPYIQLFLWAKIESYFQDSKNIRVIFVKGAFFPSGGVQ